MISCLKGIQTIQRTLKEPLLTFGYETALPQVYILRVVKMKLNSGLVCSGTSAECLSLSCRLKSQRFVAYLNETSFSYMAYQFSVSDLNDSGLGYLGQQSR